MGRQGHIYAPVPQSHRVYRFDDMSGSDQHALGGFGTSVGQFYNPLAMALDSVGRIYVVDQANHRIVRFENMAGAGWQTLGIKARGSLQFNFPSSIAFDRAGGSTLSMRATTESFGSTT